MSYGETPRDTLIAQVAVLLGVERKDHEAFAVDRAWKRGEAFVAGLEAAPDVPVKCPCCTKLVTLCREHYLLHEPGKKCLQCWESE